MGARGGCAGAERPEGTMPFGETVWCLRPRLRRCFCSSALGTDPKQPSATGGAGGGLGGRGVFVSTVDLQLAGRQQSPFHEGLAGGCRWMLLVL